MGAGVHAECMAGGSGWAPCVLEAGGPVWCTPWCIFDDFASFRMLTASTTASVAGVTVTERRDLGLSQLQGRAP